jgi:hypothetical protein
MVMRSLGWSRCYRLPLVALVAATGDGAYAACGGRAGDPRLPVRRGCLAAGGIRRFSRMWSKTVRLRGLLINGGGNGLTGIKVVAVHQRPPRPSRQR